MTIRWRVIAVIILVAVGLTGCGNVPNSVLEQFQRPAQDEYVIVSYNFAPNGEGPGKPFPFGSTILHWENGITEVFGPDNNRILIAWDADQPKLAVPGGGGLQPVTTVLSVPNDSRVEPDGDTTRAYLDGELILIAYKVNKNYPP